MVPPASSPGRSRTVVVGAGVFGAAAALELRRRGRDVLLLDRGTPPHPEASSTDVSKVVRPDYGADALYTDLALEALEGWERWNRQWPAPPYHPDGFLVLAGQAMEPGGFEFESRRMLEGRGLAVEPLDRAALGRRFPAWSADSHPEGYWNPRAGWAESAAVVRRLVRLGREAGVEVRRGARVVGLDGRFWSHRTRGVRTADGGRIAADEVVVAAGAWTPALLPHLEGALRATAQDVVLLGVEDPERWRAPRFPTWAADVARTGWYGFPALPDGRLKIGHHGPGRPHDPSDPSPGTVPAAHVERLRDFLRTSLPGLVDAPVVASRVCLYCDTADGDFWIARDPDRTGLTVAAGGSGHGFKFAPVLGGLVADVVEGVGDPPAERFRWREGPEELRAEPARMLRDEP